jgi:transcriptional regulator with XRE-family HTH domain
VKEVKIMNQEDDEKIGERLRRFRDVRGLTRAVLAQKLGVSKEDLEDVEAGEKKLPREWVETLRDLFALDPAWLLGGRGPE